MSAQPERKAADRNPRTIEEARMMVTYVESLFMPWNVDALVEGFTPDCVVRFGAIDEFRGREALRDFFEARRQVQQDYHPQKHLRTLVDDTMTNVWTGTWQDAATGTAMKGQGIEVWQLRDGKIAVWEAAFTTAPADESTGFARPFGG